MTRMETVLAWIATPPVMWRYWYCVIKDGGCGEQILELPPVS